MEVNVGRDSLVAHETVPGTDINDMRTLRRHALTEHPFYDLESLI